MKSFTASLDDVIEMRRSGIEGCSHVPVVNGMCYCVEKTRLHCWCGEDFLNDIVDGKMVHSANDKWLAHLPILKCGPWMGL